MNHLTDLDSIAAWLHLDYTKDLPLIAVRALLGMYGSPTAVLQAPLADLARITSEAAAIAIKTNVAPNEQRAQWIDAALTWLVDAHYQGTRHILTWDDPSYPKQLLTISDPPLTLFVQGSVQALSQPAVGVVGARNATAQGIANAGVFAQHLADRAVTVVSGLALGIDAAAHEGALLSQSAYATVAVVGTGIDRVYPAVNRDLAHRIAAQGAVVSEFPIGAGPLPYHFPRRNRLISGLSRGVLVVEAAIRSGSLITARVAGEQGREVLAIPGSIHAPLSKGCHQLIKQGAKLVESGQDVVEELSLHRLNEDAGLALDAQLKSDSVSLFDEEGLLGSASELPNTSKPALQTGKDLLAQLSDAPMSVDQMVLQTGMSIAQLMAQLTELELLGEVALVQGGLYQRVQ